MDWSATEKRIGRRQQVRSVPIAWCKEPDRPGSYQAETAPDGRIVEVSVSGMGVVARTDTTIEVGDRMMTQALGAIGPVIVRRLDHHLYPGESYYGVEFAEPNSPFTQSIYHGLLERIADVPTQYLPRG